jgi:plasmid stabilization system protein ParE
MSLLAIRLGEQTRSVGDNVLARLDAVRQTHCLANKFAPTERARVAREAFEAGRRPWEAPNPGPLRSPSSPS